MRLILKQEAVEDMVAIYKYSVATFGERRADEYYEGLEQRMDDLATGEVMISYDYGYVREGLRRTIYESHSIYYREKEEDIVVSRILHSRMDVTLHLH